MRLALVVLAALLALAEPAQAHGPCIDCLSVEAGPPGTKVMITDTPAYWVLWNGRVEDPDNRVIELRRLSRPQKGVTFIVPAVRTGTYRVTIYDGSEGGSHRTWALFSVRPRDDGVGLHLWWVVLGCATATALIYGARRSIAQRSPSRR